MTGREAVPGSEAPPGSETQSSGDGATGHKSVPGGESVPGSEAVPGSVRENREVPQSEVEFWAALRRLTPARVGLARTGDAPSLPAVLDFQHAHAKARDAINNAIDTASLAARLAPVVTMMVTSAAGDRATYLKRPDLGRRLSDASRAKIERDDRDLVIVIGDGLSATAVERHAVPVVAALLPQLEGWRIGPVVIATQARVALGDEIGERTGAAISVVLIGERPGLSVSDSLGIYLTFGPRVGRRDAERNCISNIHLNGGLTPAEAARRLAWLLSQSRRRRLSGVQLKDQSDTPPGLAPPA